MDRRIVVRKADLEAIERAMVLIRRSQTRRTLARLAGQADTATFDVLDVLEAAEESGEHATVSVVAESLRVDQPRASKLVAAAVEAGLVRRVADQTDGRRSFLVRTAKGRAAVERVHEFRRAQLANAMADWSAADRATFARLLTRFTAGLPTPPR
jgi:DNA-binding MarR family transcriptional regulator